MPFQVLAPVRNFTAQMVVFVSTQMEQQFVFVRWATVDLLVIKVILNKVFFRTRERDREREMSGLSSNCLDTICREDALSVLFINMACYIEEQ